MPGQSYQSRKTEQQNIKQDIIVKSVNNEYFYRYQNNNQGLPNMGNTCFLNSAIQFLYSSSLFREVIKQTKNKQSQSLEDNLIKIFVCIKSQKSYSQKRSILEKIIETLRIEKSDYEKFSQQDCFQFILLIIDNIGIRHNEILQFFKLYYKYECQNCNNPNKRKEFIMFSENMNCEVCGKNVKVRYISIPKCMITANLHKHHLQIKTVQQRQINYRLVAKVIYIGNGKHGHYKVCRRKNDDPQNDKFFSFSDDLIQQQRTAQYFTCYQRTLLALYEIDQTIINPNYQQPCKNVSKNHQNENRGKANNKCNTNTLNQDHELQQALEPVKSNQLCNNSSLNIQVSYGFKFLFQYVTVLDFEKIFKTLYQTKSLKKLIQASPYPSNKIIRSMNRILYYFQSLYQYRERIINQQLQQIKKYLISSCNNYMSPLIAQLLQTFPLQNNKQQKPSNPLIILFITFIQLFAQEIPSIKNAFKFSFYYDFCGCNYQTNRNFGVFFMSNVSYFCCNRKMQPRQVSIIQKPTYLIFVGDKSQQQYVFNRLNQKLKSAYSLKGSIMINKNTNFQIYEESIYRVDLRLPNEQRRFYYQGPNMLLGDFFLKQRLQQKVKKSLDQVRNMITINFIQQKSQYLNLAGKQLYDLRSERQSTLHRKYWLDTFYIDVKKIS